LFQRRILQAAFTICAAIALTQHGARAQQSYEVIAQNGVTMKTRDGVTLRADIYRPKAEGKFPVILMRTPYDKSVGWAASPAYQIAAHGYVVIVQDVRGRYTSEGEFLPIPPRVRRRLRCRRMGRCAAILERQSRDDGRLLCRGNSDACCDWPSSASGRNLPRGDGQQLSRQLDVSRRSARTVV